VESRQIGDDRCVADADQEFDSRATDRLTLFSDAVVAIAITLLAIDLPVPTGDTLSAFLTSVRDNIGHYGAFLLSFGAIAGAWSNHHDVFQHTVRIDARLRRLDMTWLLLIVLTPFATRLLTSHGNPTTSVHALKFGFYALVQALESWSLLAMLRYMTSNGLSRGLPARTVATVTRQEYILIAGFALSIPVLFVTTWGWLLWFAVPLALGQWHRSHRRQRSDEDKNEPRQSARQPRKPAE
jgi:uncharacterized membrane protein